MEGTCGGVNSEEVAAAVNRAFDPENNCFDTAPASGNDVLSEFWSGANARLVG